MATKQTTKKAERQNSAGYLIDRNTGVVYPYTKELSTDPNLIEALDRNGTLPKNTTAQVIDAEQIKKDTEEQLLTRLKDEGRLIDDPASTPSSDAPPAVTSMDPTGVFKKVNTAGAS